jgi:hypothetical protein
VPAALEGEQDRRQGVLGDPDGVGGVGARDAEAPFPEGRGCLTTDRSRPVEHDPQVGGRCQKAPSIAGAPQPERITSASASTPGYFATEIPV